MATTHDENSLWDVRTLERKLRKGLITKKDIEKYQKALLDVSEKIAPADRDEAESDV
jgi:predicted RNA-binding protein associated with RNAse of E/G family